MSMGSQSRSRALILVPAALVLIAGCSAHRGSGPERLAARAGASALCVTDGQVHPIDGGRLEVDDAAMRAVAVGTAGDAGELEFTYEGPTREVAPLANGELRRQIGLKL